MKKIIIASIVSVLAIVALAGDDCRSCYTENDFGAAGLRDLASTGPILGPMTSLLSLWTGSRTTVITNYKTEKHVYVTVSIAKTEFKLMGQGLPSVSAFQVKVVSTDLRLNKTYTVPAARVRDMLNAANIEKAKAAARVAFDQRATAFSHTQRGYGRSASNTWISRNSHLITRGGRSSSVRIKITISGCGGIRCRKNN